MSKEYIELRCLTWKEPFASLMFDPFDKIETRKWSTKYRGWVAIHAAQSPYSKNKLDEMGALIPSIYKPDKFRLGKIIGYAYLADCRPMKKADEQKCYIKYKPGRFCHIYTNVVLLKEFIPFKGKQGWARINDKFMRKNFPLRLYKENKRQLSLF